MQKRVLTNSQPVCNEDGNVVGLLDITKVFHEAVDKVERSSNASEKLYNALAGVQTELGGISTNPQTTAMLAYVEALREKTALPDLTTVMDSRTEPATVGPKATVREVAKIMREKRVTAVCVMENAVAGPVPGAPRIAGIFTSKDIVLRVIAAGLDSGRCSVVRVMTPHPDTAVPTTTVHDALKKMHSKRLILVTGKISHFYLFTDGHFLNLPVVEADGRLIAIVDVLKLTYATLEQVHISVFPTRAPAHYPIDEHYEHRSSRRSRRKWRTDVGSLLRLHWRRRNRFCDLWPTYRYAQQQTRLYAQHQHIANAQVSRPSPR